MVATAHHEAGHCIIAALFNDKLFLKCLTIDSSLLKKVNPNYTGGLNLEFYTTPQSHEVEPGDNLILIALGGLCAKTIFKRGKQYVKDNLHLFSGKPNLMEIEGATEDYDLVRKFSLPIANVLQTRQTTVEWSAVRWVFEFLMEDEVWEATKKVAQKLLKNTNKSLVSTEISEFLDEINFQQHLENTKSIHLSKRYPLAIDKMKI